MMDTTFVASSDAKVRTPAQSVDGAHEWSSKEVPNTIMIAKPFAPAQIITAVSTAADTH